MNEFKGRVRSRRHRWLLYTTISGLFLLLMSAGFIYIISYYIGIETDSFAMRSILFTTSVWLIIALVTGQTVQGIIQQTWDTWIANLDEYTLEVLIATLIHNFEKTTGRKYSHKHEVISLLGKK